MQLEAGNSGQFDVFVGEEVIATRDKGLVRLLFGGGWPKEADVVEKLRAKLPPG